VSHLAVHAPPALPRNLRSLVEHDRPRRRVLDPTLRDLRGADVRVGDDLHAAVLAKDRREVRGDVGVEVVDQCRDEVRRAIVERGLAPDLIYRSVARVDPLDAVGVALAPVARVVEHAVLLAPVAAAAAGRIGVAAAVSGRPPAPGAGRRALRKCLRTGTRGLLGFGCTGRGRAISAAAEYSVEHDPNP